MKEKEMDGRKKGHFLAVLPAYIYLQLSYSDITWSHSNVLIPGYEGVLVWEWDYTCMSEHTYFSEGSHEELVGHLLGKVRVSRHLKFLGDILPFAAEELLATTWGLQEGEEK